MHTVLLLADVPSQTLPARSMMAFTLASHIILVPLGVALPLITLVMHGYGLRRDDATALLLARRWSAVMAVQFAIGVVTGTVLSFEFGLLWPGMMGRWGDVFGIGFGVEAWAFFLEAVLIAIYLYGWRRLPSRAQFLLGLPLPFTALLGAFGILAANSWMNTPRGFTLDAAGNPVDVKIWQAVFTPMFGPQYWHFVVAMFVSSSSPRSPCCTGWTPMASWRASPTPTCGAAAPVTRADLAAGACPGAPAVGAAPTAEHR
ncbi:cytochrome ubiquinol oxidase subunit I [Streptomyces sp. NPDC001153]